MRTASVLRSRRLAIWASPVALTLGLSAGAVGCAVGTSADTFRPATQPGGARIHLRVDGGRVSGELLEVTDESLLVLIDATGPAATVTGGVVRVFRYPVVTILRADVDQYGRMRPRLVQDRERMRLVSRFPQGVDDELERRLLEAYGQTEVGGGEPRASQGERDAFLTAVRGATDRYSDPDRAISDGFVAVGAEAPAMGRHWVHPDRVVAGVEPSRPSVLSYVEVDGDRVLAGVGFAVAGRTDRAPVVPGVPDDRWHYHSGSMEAEGHRIDHESDAASPEDRAAVAVLHVWIPIENPLGIFAPDNWSLPYVRLGLRPQPDAPISAAKALSLLHGGRGFFERQWSLSQGEPADAGRRRELAEALRSIEEEVRAWWEGRAPGPDLSPQTSDWLAGMWAELAPFGL